MERKQTSCGLKWRDHSCVRDSGGQGRGKLKALKQHWLQENWGERKGVMKSINAACILLVCCCFLKGYKLKIGIPRGFVRRLLFVVVTVDDFWLFDKTSLKATHRTALCKRNRT